MRRWSALLAILANRGITDRRWVMSTMHVSDIPARLADQVKAPPVYRVASLVPAGVVSRCKHRGLLDSGVVDETTVLSASGGLAALAAPLPSATKIRPRLITVLADGR